MPKIARLSKHDEPFKNHQWECAKPWPDDCFVQCGDGGIVFYQDESGNHSHYDTAFFEAFPNSPSTFIRGEGQSIEEAEAKAWADYEKYCACSAHEFERRDYDNGVGFCRHCGMFSSGAFEPVRYPCPVCGELTRFMADNDKGYWCREHWREMPEDKRHRWTWGHYQNDPELVERHTQEYQKTFAAYGVNCR